MLRFWSVSDYLEFFLGECYGFREMAKEHEDEMLRFQVLGEWVFLRFSSWMLGKNTGMKTTQAVGEKHDLGLLGFRFVSW